MKMLKLNRKVLLGLMAFGVMVLAVFAAAPQQAAHADGPCMFINKLLCSGEKYQAKLKNSVLQYNPDPRYRLNFEIPNEAPTVTINSVETDDAIGRWHPAPRLSNGVYSVAVKPTPFRSCNNGVCSNFAADMRIMATGHDREDGALTVHWTVTERNGGTTTHSGNTLQTSLHLHHYYASVYDIWATVTDSAGQTATAVITVEAYCDPFLGCTGVEYE